jgi:diacylglycerol kinase (ATP)
MHNEPLKLFFVINPISGGKEKADWENEIRTFFRTSPHSMEFFLLTGKGDKTSVQHHIDAIKPDRVVAVGGDGTVKMLAEILKETTIPLGIVPAGSANGMARELNIPLNVTEALNVIIGGKCNKIDVIRINEEHICIHLSDLGLNAMLVKYFEASKKRGMWGYGKAIFRVMWEKQKMKATIHTDEGTYKRYAFMVVLANARKYGTGANINPEGELSDGYFEVVVVRKLNVIEIVKAIFTDRTFHPRRIEIFKTRIAEIAVHSKAHFQVDGEYFGKTKNVHARVLQQVLYIMQP